MILAWDGGPDPPPLSPLPPLSLSLSLSFLPPKATYECQELTEEGRKVLATSKREEKRKGRRQLELGNNFLFFLLKFFLLALKFPLSPTSSNSPPPLSFPTQICLHFSPQEKKKHCLFIPRFPSPFPLLLSLPLQKKKTSFLPPFFFCSSLLGSPNTCPD